MKLIVSIYDDYCFIQFENKIEEGVLFIKNIENKTLEQHKIKNKDFMLLKIPYKDQKVKLIIKNKSNQMIYEDIYLIKKT